MLKVACAFLTCSLMACLVGNDGDQQPDVPTLPDVRLCSTSMAITGQVTNRPATPIDVCSAVGTWTFSPTVAGGTTISSTAGGVPACTSVTPPSQIEIKVAWECPAGKDCGPNATPQNSGEMGYTIAMTNAPAKSNIKFTAGGSGVCEGIVELFSNDGKELFNLHPNLMTDGSLVGQGDFVRYASDQSDSRF